MLAALGAGFLAYLLALAGIGYYCGEAPGGLDRLLARLRGDAPARRQPWWWSDNGQLNRRQRVALTIGAAAVLALGGLLFFRSTTMAVILVCLSPVYPYTLERSLRQKRRELLTAQFGIALQAMAASLRAGASLRSAVERAKVDAARMLAGQPLTPIVGELERIEKDLRMGFSLEEALVRFRDRVQLEDVSDFVGAVLLCRVRGGNVATVMASIAEIIQDKIAIRQQILMLTAGKRAEANMVTFGPPAMVVLMGFLTPEYLTPLYEQLAGQVMLAVGTALLVAAFVIGRKVLEIEI
ncbi:MAG: type II secretion system F family protein [Bacillota bacterium]